MTTERPNPNHYSGGRDAAVAGAEATAPVRRNVSRTTTKGLRVDLGLLLLTTIFVMPSTFQLRPLAFPIRDFHITVVECCIFLLLGRSIVALFMRRDVRVAGVSFDALMLTLFAVIAVSGVVGFARHGPKQMLADARQYLPLTLYFWAMRELARRERMEVLRGRVFVVMAIVAAYVLIAFAFFRPELRAYARQNELRAGHMEARVFFDNTLFLLFVYAGYLFKKIIVSRRKQFFYGFVLAANVLMLVVMQVRSYWVAFVCIVLWAALSQRRWLLRPRMIIAGAAVLSLAAAVLLGASMLEFDRRPLGVVGTSIAERVKSLTNFREAFIEGRAAGDVETLGTRWQTAAVVIDEYVAPNPLLGVSLGAELPLVDAAGGIITVNYFIDNAYLTLLAKFGVVGLLLYGVVLLKAVMILVRVLRSSAATNDERLLAGSFLAGIAACLIASWFSSVFIRQQPAIVGFLVLLAETSVMARDVHAREGSLPLRAVVSGPRFRFLR